MTFLWPAVAGLFPAVSVSEENFTDFGANFDYQFTPFGAVPEPLRTKARPLRAAPVKNKAPDID
jgi:hypothetical protein